MKAARKQNLNARAKGVPALNKVGGLVFRRQRGGWNG